VLYQLSYDHQDRPLQGNPVTGNNHSQTFRPAVNGVRCSASHCASGASMLAAAALASSLEGPGIGTNTVRR
jgi:hypothetical protein